MKIEIWSDVVCPFCYIGKRRLETALDQFKGKDSIEIEWKSFQLSPEQKTVTGQTLNQYLAEEKGWSPEYAKEMNDRVSYMAEQVGLTYHLDKAIPANTHKAHELIHLAKESGKQSAAKERLLQAYFTESKNIDDDLTLIQLGKEIGIDDEVIKTALKNRTYANQVEEDLYEARLLGIRGVPFFVFNRKYAISGAQEVSTFSQTLETSFKEWRQENPEIVHGRN
ncbi:MAG: DsbA family oxidoreductase [Bacteroidota bacterium]